MIEVELAADKEVKNYNDGHKVKCPFCHSELEAKWDTDCKGRIDYFLKCTGCTLQLQGDSMKEIYAQLNGEWPFRTLTKKDLNEFINLKNLFERKIESKFRSEGKLDRQGNYTLDILNWNTITKMVCVKVYDWKNKAKDNSIYHVHFEDLYDVEE